MHWLGLTKMLVFLSSWLGGALIIPLACILAWCKIYIPMYILLSYYGFRAIFPAAKSDAIREWMGVSNDVTPYYRSQELIFEDDACPPEPDSSTMFTVGPHGILTQGWCFLNCSPLFTKSNITWLIAEILLYLPFCKDFMIWGGGAPCTGPYFKKLMSVGANIALIPGGFEEATLYHHGKHQLYLKHRQGFIKYALQYGYKIQICYVFGEELCYWTVEVMPSLMLWLNKFKLPGVFFWGSYFFLPNPDIDMTVVMSIPMELPHIKNPTHEDVDKYHALYIEKVTALFNKFKGKYAAEGEDAVLHIV